MKIADILLELGDADRVLAANDVRKNRKNKKQKFRQNIPGVYVPDERKIPGSQYAAQGDSFVDPKDAPPSKKKVSWQI